MNGFERCRREANLTQVEAASLIGVSSASTISMWETETNCPRSNMLKKIAEVYNCSVDDLLLKEKSR